MGPSGSGKSTLLHVLGALDTADEGTVVLDGRHARRARIAHRTRGLSAAQQRRVRVPVLQPRPRLTVRENVSLPGGARRDDPMTSARERAAALLAQLGPGRAPRPAALAAVRWRAAASGDRPRADQRAVRRLADEPTGNLDRHERGRGDVPAQGRERPWSDARPGDARPGRRGARSPRGVHARRPARGRDRGHRDGGARRRSCRSSRRSSGLTRAHGLARSCPSKGRPRADSVSNRRQEGSDAHSRRDAVDAVPPVVPGGRLRSGADEAADEHRPRRTRRSSTRSRSSRTTRRCTARRPSRPRSHAVALDTVRVARVDAVAEPRKQPDP